MIAHILPIIFVLKFSEIPALHDFVHSVISNAAKALLNGTLDQLSAGYVRRCEYRTRENDRDSNCRAKARNFDRFHDNYYYVSRLAKISPADKISSHICEFVTMGRGIKEGDKEKRESFFARGLSRKCQTARILMRYLSVKLKKYNSWKQENARKSKYFFFSIITNRFRRKK